MRLRRCGGDTSSAPFGGICLPAGRSTDLTGHRRIIQHREPPRGKAFGVRHSAPRTPQGEGLGVRRVFKESSRFFCKT